MRLCRRPRPGLRPEDAPRRAESRPRFISAEGSVVRPFGAGRLQFGRRGAACRLDRGDGVIVALDLGVNRCSEPPPGYPRLQIKKDQDMRFHSAVDSMGQAQPAAGSVLFRTWVIVCRTTLTFTPSAISTSTMPSSCTFETLPTIPPEVTTWSPRRSASTDHRAVFLHLLLLRTDQQEIEDDEDQDDRQELRESGPGGPGLQRPGRRRG